MLTLFFYIYYDHAQSAVVNATKPIIYKYDFYLKIITTTWSHIYIAYWEPHDIIHRLFKLDHEKQFE